MIQILQAVTTDQDRILRFFHYIPSKALAIVGLAVYALFVIYLSLRVYRSRSSKFLYILPITAIMECIGYLIRTMCSESVSMEKYIGMTMFLLLLPNALALVNYKAVGEVVRLSNVQTDRFYLRPKFVTWFFFSSDIFAFWLQGSGGGLQQMEKEKNIGVAITLVGLAVQLIFFACFVLITIHIHRNPAYNYHVEGRPNAKINLLFVCILLLFCYIFVQSIVLLNTPPALVVLLLVLNGRFIFLTVLLLLSALRLIVYYLLAIIFLNLMIFLMVELQPQQKSHLLLPLVRIV